MMRFTTHPPRPRPGARGARSGNAYTENESGDDLTTVQVSSKQVDAILAYQRRRARGALVGGTILGAAVTGLAAYLFWVFKLRPDIEAEFGGGGTDDDPDAGDGPNDSDPDGDQGGPIAIELSVVGETVFLGETEGTLDTIALPSPPAPESTAHIDATQGSHGVVEALQGRLTELGWIVTVD